MPSLLRLKLLLRDSDPPITRVLEVPADYSVYELHLALQVSLGWNDMEAFEFLASKLTVGVEPGYSGDGFEHRGHRYRHADEVEAATLFAVPGQTIRYTYDFGRQWNFDLKLLAITEGESELPVCIEASAAAPPEDVDDLDSFYGMQLAYFELDHPLHSWARDELGEDFQPQGPDPADITALLATLFSDSPEPHGTDEEDDWSWWDPSKYDDKMRLRVLQSEIEERLPKDLAAKDTGEKHQALLRILRGEA